MEIKTVSIIGLGALGILFGNHLSQRMPKQSLRIIADSERIKKYTTEQVYCNGKPCDFYYMTPLERCEPADLVIFTVKYSGLNDAIAAVKKQVGENTIILSALNGISSEEIIGQTFGMDKILYCVAQGMDAVKSGNHLTYHHMGMLCFGDRQPGMVSDKTRAVADFFDRTQFPYQVVTDMQHRLWGKFMLNVGVNQTVAVYQSNYGEVQKQGPARDLMIKAMQEVMVLAQKEGIPLTEADLQYWLDVLGRLNPQGMPSMRQDLAARRYSEVELFAGTVLQLGKKHRVDTPVNKMLYERIQFIESQYQSVTI